MKKTAIVFQILIIFFTGISVHAQAKNSKPGIDGVWRYTVKNSDNGAVTELKLTLAVKGSRLNGKFDFTPVARESLDASDEVIGKIKPLRDVYLEGTVKGNTADAFFDSGADNSRVKISVVYNAKTDTLSWRLNGSSRLSIPRSAELYRLDQKKWLDAGNAFFKRKDYSNAVAAYYKAVAANEKNADAQYLLSGALAKMALSVSRPESEMEDRSFYTAFRAILELDAAIALNKAAAAKAKKDDAWRGLSKRVHFLVVVNGYDCGNPQHMKEILITAGTFYKRSPGTAPELILTFKKDGTFTIANIMDENFTPETLSGTWRIEGDSVFMRVTGGAEEALKFRLDAESGSIVLGEWFDHPDTSGGI